MDPLSAISLAGNIVQFVTFAASLISKTREVHKSGSGTSSNVQVLDNTYAELLNLSSKLGKSSHVTGDSRNLENSDFNHIFAIEHLSVICKNDCVKLLQTLQKLKGVQGSGRWKSFTMALKAVWRSDEINALEQRLHHVQTTLTLHICAGASNWQKDYTQQFLALQRECINVTMQHTSKLGEIGNTITEWGERIAKVQSNSSFKSCQPDEIASLENQMFHLSPSSEDRMKQKMIINSLRFESCQARYSSVQEAHEKTFSWVFKESLNNSEEQETDRVQNWLRNGDDIFWVSGKPGSGKSTFMKFITKEINAQQALQSWSYPKATIFASHFFWSAGTPMQRSQQGLLQTLLYEIFKQLPGLIENSCIVRWWMKPDQLEYKSWGIHELREVIKQIAGLQNLPVQFCFFIDGLDEFEGDYVDFCQALKNLSHSEHVKLCVSSRPWNVFEDYFGQDNSTKLYMQDVTKDDIQLYVRDRLEQHPRWSELNVEVGNAQSLVENITEKASGVFLWVFLVTQQLRKGLCEYDSFSDLQSRLSRIPADLESFFKQILESVEPVHCTKMATTLRFALATSRPLPTALYTFHDMEYEDEDYAMKLESLDWDIQQEKQRHERITRRLNARCRGLLEVNASSKKVEFLHRTVSDYLRSTEMSEYLDRNTPKHYNLHLAIIRAFTAYIVNTVKMYDALEDAGEIFESIAEETFTHARELNNDPRAIQLLGAMEIRFKGVCPVTHRFFQHAAVKTSAISYISHCLDHDPGYFAGAFGPPELPVLSYALTLFLRSHHDEPAPLNSCAGPSRLTQLLSCLLEFAFDPNQIFSQKNSNNPMETTPLRDLSTKIYTMNHKLENPGPEETICFKAVLRFRLLQMMLSHGAHPNDPISPLFDHGPVSTAFTAFLWSFFFIADESFYQELYMEALNSFLDAGADLNLQATPVESSNVEVISSGLGYFLTTLLEYGKKTYIRIKNSAVVTETLLSAAQDHGCNIEPYFRAFQLDQFFPPKIARGLKDRLLGPVALTLTSYTYSEPPTKRALDEDEEQPRELKRARFGEMDIG